MEKQLRHTAAQIDNAVDKIETIKQSIVDSLEFKVDENGYLTYEFK